MRNIVFYQASAPNYVNKFAMTITNKWPLLFLESNSIPLSVVLTARILALIFTLLKTQRMCKSSKFHQKGLLVLSHLLSVYWRLTQLHETLLSMMIGINVEQHNSFLTLAPW